MSKKIQPLFALQDLDFKIVGMRRQKEGLPRELEPDQKNLDETRQRVEMLKSEAKELKQKIAQSELALAEAEEKIKKLNVQSNTVKKNDEYQALMKEINQIRADKGVTEDGLLELYSRVEQGQTELKKAEGDVKTSEERLNQVKKRVDEAVAEIDRNLKQLEDDRCRQSKTVDSELLKVYERILTAKADGMVMAAVVDENCQECNMSITSQEINLIMIGKDLVHCKACSRILYLPSSDHE